MRTSITVVFLVMLLFSSFSEEPVKEPSGLLEQILQLKIAVRIYDTRNDWNFNNSRLTIPGKAVTLKMEGKEIKINGSFTPYYQEDKLMLLAQTQVSIKIAGKIEIFSSFKTLEIVPGEKLLFYPLGRSALIVSPETAGDKAAVEIEVEPEAIPDNTPFPGHSCVIEIGLEVEPYHKEAKQEK